jgi:uncharacterized membrane protein YfcA
MVEAYFLLALIGVAGGLISGLVGLAGGIFIVPALVAAYGTQAMGDAIVVSYFAVLFNSIATSRTNFSMVGRQTYVALIRSANWYLYGAIAASVLVAILFGRHKDALPKELLALLQLMLAACMLLPRKWYEKANLTRNSIKDGSVGILVGGMSTLIGVGGGTYTISYFMVHGRQIKDCTLTANFVGIFIGLASLVGYFGYQLFASGGHMNTGVSVIDATGKAILVVAGIAAAPLGVKLQSMMPAQSIKRLIVLMLAVSSSYVLFS